MKSDERRLLDALLSDRPIAYSTGRLATEVGDELGIPAKRTLYILEKWEDSGFWESGVSTRSGWFTPEGIAEFESRRRLG